jgi:hypothetical protein
MELEKISLHPLVPLQILNSYVRGSRNTNSTFSFGALFGYDNNDTLEVKYSYALVELEEMSTSELESIFNIIIQSHKLISKKEVFVGWFDFFCLCYCLFYLN